MLKLPTSAALLYLIAFEIRFPAAVAQNIESGTCMEGDVEYFLDDLPKQGDNNGKTTGFGEVPSEMDCYEKCYSITECKYFTYDSPYKWCLVKHDNSGRRKYKGGISGSRSCSVPEKRIGKCFFQDMGYQGNDLRSIAGVEAPEACQDACALDDGCKAWTHAKPTCFLKRNAVGKSYIAGEVSGLKHCNCFELNVDFATPSSTLDTMAGIAGVLDCQALCKRRSDCNFISFDKTGGNCYLLSSAGYQRVATHISAMRSCETELVEPCFLDGWEFRGHDVGFEFAASEEQCQKQCQATSDCSFFTFAQNTCNMKSSDVGMGRRLGQISGPKWCDKPSGTSMTTTTPAGALTTSSLTSESYPIQGGSSMEGDVEYALHDLPGQGDDDGEVTGFHGVPDEKECFELCYSNTECKYFSYSVPHNSCFVKSSNSGKRKQSGFISGSRDCYKNETRVGTCFYKSINYYYNAISKTTGVSSADDCQGRCEREAECKAFTLEGPNCWLKRNTAGMTRVWTAATSGPKYCSCFEVNANFDGTAEAIRLKDIPGVATVLGCQALCAQLGGCNFISFEKATHHCYLLSKAGYSRATTHISGMVKCETGLTGRCFLKDWEFRGHDIGSVSEVLKAEDCQQRCQERSNCHSFTFAGTACHLKSSDLGIGRRIGYVSGPKRCP